jgi:predicted enzyme related to lactoylglutathione lyase
MKQANTFCWIDIPVLNLDRAIEFYSEILDAPVQKISEHHFTFGLLPHSEENVSGCLCEMDDRKPSADGPLIYLNVEGKLDKAIAAAEKKGVRILKAKEQIGPYGNRAVIMDTEGNAIALYSKQP